MQDYRTGEFSFGALSAESANLLRLRSAGAPLHSQKAQFSGDRWHCIATACELSLCIERVGSRIRNPRKFSSVTKALAARLGRDSAMRLRTPNESHLGKLACAGSSLGS